jgi:addiction module HigA family antidote
MATETVVKYGPAFAPSHPGEILREEILPALGIAKTRLADHLGISRQTLYAILSEERALTADVAARLARAFGNNAAFWLNLQSQHDAWHAARSPDVAKIKPLPQAVAAMAAGRE